MGSITTSGTTGGIRRTANIPQYTAVTFAGWFQINSGAKAAAATQFICGIGSASFTALLVDASGNLAYRRLNGANSTMVAAASWTEGDWYYGAITGTTGAQSAYIFNSSGTRIGLNNSAETPTPSWTAMAVGNRYDTGQGVAGKFSHWKVWDHTLSQAEIEAEMFEPVFLTGPDYYADVNTGFADTAIDIGPNSRDWTETNTGTDADTPPVNPLGLTPIVLTWTM
jgi:hypothetical protein